jgi:hypothetical protein
MIKPRDILLFACVVLLTTRELYSVGSCRLLTSIMTKSTGDDASSMDASNSSPATTSQQSSSRSQFHAAASDAYSLILEHDQQQEERTKFDVSKWKQTTSGGLNQEDREMLGRIYGNASSVFEFGLGESTYLANHVGVPRYSGIDSDAEWISMVRNNVSGHYRFYFADIGMTGDWGSPLQELKKAVYNYQVVPLFAEPQPFDVYMVDGRFRVGCLLLSFLHASSSSLSSSSSSEHEFVATMHNSPTVLVHDCHREYYHVADHLLDLVEHTVNLCAYKRKNGTTDEQLYAMWTSEFNKAG